jgi:hypothetical protein
MPVCGGVFFGIAKAIYTTQEVGSPFFGRGTFVIRSESHSWTVIIFPLLVVSHNPYIPNTKVIQAEQ